MEVKSKPEPEKKTPEPRVKPEEREAEVKIMTEDKKISTQEDNKKVEVNSKPKLGKKGLDIKDEKVTNMNVTPDNHQVTTISNMATNPKSNNQREADILAPYANITTSEPATKTNTSKSLEASENTPVNSNATTYTSSSPSTKNDSSDTKHVPSRNDMNTPVSVNILDEPISKDEPKQEPINQLDNKVNEFFSD